VNGIHDLGGRHGFGRVEPEPNEPVFHHGWEKRVFGAVSFALAGGIANIDRFRHAIERLDPVYYLSAGYYGRWLGGLELVVREWLAAGEQLERGEPGSMRPIEQKPRFAPGDAVRTKNHQPSGHTRLPAYARARRGTIAIVHASCVLPDTHAHGRGENPEWVYAVRFDAAELFGDAAEPNACVHIDLFESYLEAEHADV